MFIVYKTTNMINDKIYIGVHHVIQNRPDYYLGTGKLILAAIKKHGKENFKRETLYEFKTSEEAFSKEAEIVNEKFLSRSDVYNLIMGGRGGTIHTDETKAKISAANRNRIYKPVSSESKIKMSITHKGKKLSSEHRKKIGEAGKGRKLSKTHIQSITASLRGVPRTEKDKKSMREAFFNTPDKICPYCNKSCKPAPYKRWHGDNCKQRGIK